jgi:hypothetical protein
MGVYRYSGMMRPAGIALLLTLFCVAGTIVERKPENTHDRFINGDMKAYYAYLPAVFVYQDLSFSFIEQIEATHYDGDPALHKDFRVQTETGTVNKVMPGMALMLLPFFLLAHVLALAGLSEPDGYSWVYQWSVQVAIWTYLFLGLMTLMALLRRLHFTLLVAGTVAAVLTLATNLWYYSAFDTTVPHVVNFFLVALALLLIVRFQQSGKKATLMNAFIIIGLLVIIRPTHVLTALLPVIPFVGQHRLRTFLSWSGHDLRNLMLRMPILLTVIAIPVGLWLIQTGKPFVYGYGSERFYWDSPRMIALLTSFRQGWWVYTPAMLLIIPGLFMAYRMNRKMAVGIGIYGLIFIYVSSCWWAWWYGGCFGQRVMIDYYALMAIPLAFFARWTLLRAQLMLVPLALLGFLNIFQAWQFRHGVLHGGLNTRALYADAFLSTTPTAITARPFLEHRITGQAPVLGEAGNSEGWITDGRLRSESGSDVHTFTSRESPFSATFRGSIPDGTNAVWTRFQLKADERPDSTTVVIQISGSHPAYYASHVGLFVKPGEWTTMSFMAEIPETSPGDSVTFYCWNGGSDELVLINDIALDFLWLSGKEVR